MRLRLHGLPTSKGGVSPKLFPLPDIVASAYPRRPMDARAISGLIAGEGEMLLCDRIQNPDSYQAELGHIVVQTLCAMDDR